MSVWDTYNARLVVNGNTRRENALARTQGYINRKLSSSLSYQPITINNVSQKVSIVDTEELNIKTICALPGESLLHGGIVDWEENKWLITEIDAHNEVYEKGTMQQCNHLLRWRDISGNIIEKWSIVEDGTKYLIGEKQEDIMSVGDARIAVTVPKDSDTVNLKRGNRFLIDDVDTSEVLAYQITKPNRLYNIFNNNGIFRYILKEVNPTDNDNLELRVADYYQPPMNTSTDSYPDIIDDNDEKKVWI